MNTVTIIELSKRRDQKLYPARPLTRAERNRIRWLEHNLVHRDRLSIRAAQRLMLEQHAVRRSLGAICQDLRRFECPACAEPPGG